MNAHTAIYLDANATTKPEPEVVSAMRSALEHEWANPSSIHRFGQEARRRVDEARQQIASLIGAMPRDVMFTAGGTEAANLAIFGIARRSEDRPVVITSTVEHSAVRAPTDRLEAQGMHVVRVPVDRDGLIDRETFRSVMSEHAGRIGLITLLWANNETGVIQPLADLIAIAREVDDRAIIHTDAVQCAGKVPIDVQQLGVDLLSISAHKFHGPKGVGALFVRPRLRLEPMCIGGGQERDRRGGTENVPGIVGMGVAATLAMDRMARGVYAPDGPVATLRDQLERTILDAVADSVVNGSTHPLERLPNTTNIGFHRLEAEAILIQLSERGISASAGAACSSGSLEPSPIIQAMGVEREYAHGSIRLSIDHRTTARQIERGALGVIESVNRVRQVLPV